MRNLTGKHFDLSIFDKIEFVEFISKNKTILNFPFIDSISKKLIRNEESRPKLTRFEKVTSKEFEKN